MHPPTVTANPASPIGQVKATMKATVNANFHATSACYFEYADDVSFQANGYAGASQADCPSLPDGSSNTGVSVTLSSLAPSTTYHYRIVAANNAGTETSGSVTFTTLPLTAATVSTEPASSVAITEAKISGKVNPHGGSVSDCHFEYGPTLSYGTSVTCPTAVGIVDADVSENRNIAGLLPATTYHYRLSVTTNAGAVAGTDREFTTSSPPSPEEPPPSESSAPAPRPAPIVIPPTVDPPKRLVCRKGFRKRRVHGKLRCVKRHKKRRGH
jgi:phosphodiesterase/alkaline phosphatase D-like protein